MTPKETRQEGFTLYRSGTGFTLVEILIAFSIFIVIMGLVSMSFVQLFRSFKQGQKLSEKEQRQRSCLFWMSKEISSLVKVVSPQKNIKAEEKEFFFIFAKEANLAESKYVCNTSGKVLEHYYQEPTDYDENTYQTKYLCLEDLEECAFSYSDGKTWKSVWSQEEEQSLLPRMVKITFKVKNEVQAKDFIINIPVSK